ncbi:MAG: PIN domain-containing protein [Proteobacteria bacterium]|nr:PIN domain-containing protein [Pseudomonadota bacterium]MBS0554256.1 PIN domain-containing protein [Pseudomonadota bacterium]
MKYLLDTCTVSDFVKGQPGVLARIKATSPNQIVVSSITRMEIDYGLALNSAGAKRLWPLLDAFFAVTHTVAFDAPDAQAAAAIRAALKRQGQPIGAYDALIAGSGVARGLIVVTSNVDEFARVSGLQVENWR